MPKLNVLVIAYYFPPAKAVAGQRVYSWCKYFPKEKFNITFVTRKWEGTESSWSDLMKNAKGNVEEEILFGNRVLRLPSHSLLDNFLIKNFGFLERPFRFILNHAGYFNVETDAHRSFKKYLEEYLKTNKTDLILVSSPPLNLVRLAYDLNKKFAVPYHLDFRDLWSNEYLKEQYIPDASRARVDGLKEKFLEKWMRNAKIVTIDSKAKADILHRVYKGSIDVVTNGFDHELYENSSDKFPEFTITLSGTYYPQQPLEIFLEGIITFLDEIKPSDFKIMLVGLEVLGDSIEKIKTHIPSFYLVILPRETQEKNAEILSRSHVTFLPSWYGYKGLYTTKLFDMIASRSKVLIAPGDKDVMDDTVIKTRTGKVVYSAVDFNAYLKQCYFEWKEKGSISSDADYSEINKFSRKNTALQLAEIIEESFRKGKN